MGTGLILTRGAIATILAETAAVHPREACGLLLGQGRKVAEARPAANVHAEPARHFEIDPAALIAAHRAAREGGPQVLGYWHSHPNGRAGPSGEDQASAAGDGQVWVIAAKRSITVWIDAPDGFKPLPYDVADG